MKLKKTVISALPFDCWGVIITFIGNNKDFLNLILSVRGLYKYVKTNPFCLHNVEFLLCPSINHLLNKEIDCKRNYVKSLGIPFVEFCDDYYSDQSLGKCLGLKEEKSFYDIIEMLSGLFVQLEKFCLRESFFMYNHVSEVDLRSFSDFKFLKVISLRFQMLDVKITKRIPKLEHLEVYNMENERKYVHIKPDLRLKEELCPSLNVIILHGYTLCFKLSSFKDSLEILTLSDCQTIDEELEGYLKLRVLKICKENENIRKIENLPSLEILTYESLGIAEYNFDNAESDVCFGANVNEETGNLHIKGFPKLKKVQIHNGFSMLRLPLTTYTCFEDLPELRSLSLKCDNMKVIGLEKMKTIQCSSMENVEFANTKYLVEDLTLQFDNIKSLPVLKNLKSSIKNFSLSFSEIDLDNMKGGIVLKLDGFCELVSFCNTFYPFKAWKYLEFRNLGSLQELSVLSGVANLHIDSNVLQNLHELRLNITHVELSTSAMESNRIDLENLIHLKSVGIMKNSDKMEKTGNYFIERMNNLPSLTSLEIRDYALREKDRSYRICNTLGEVGWRKDLSVFLGSSGVEGKGKEQSMEEYRLRCYS